MTKRQYDEYQDLVDGVILCLNHYNVFDKDTLLDSVRNDTDRKYGHLISFVEYRKDKHAIYNTAVGLFKQKTVNLSLENCVQYTCTKNEYRLSADYMTLTECYDTWLEWVDNMRWDPDQFIDDLFTVLDRKGGKRNCMFLMGESNAGKSMMFAHPIEKLMRNVGQIVNINCDSAFIFEDCRTSRLISIEECAIPKKFVDELKKIMGGERVKVQVKYVSGGGTVNPTPVICTSNKEPWIYCNTDESALRNRMRYYCCSNSFDRLADFQGQLFNPLFYCLLWYVWSNDLDITYLDKSEDDLYILLDNIADSYKHNLD